MRRHLASLAAILLAACNKGPGTGGPVTSEPTGPIASGRAATENQAGTADVNALVAGELPPPGPLPRFVGHWAADEQSCGSQAWVFSTTSLQTPAGSSCSFNQVTEVPGGYDIQAVCTAEGPPKPDTLKIRFAESAKAMLFNSKVIAGNGLVFCGRPA